jgi:anti-sigma B factor antagonist
MVISLPLEITKKQIAPGIVALELAGAIHMGPACHQIAQEVEQLLGRSENRIIFDLSKATFLDSGGLGEIVRCFSKIKKSGGSLRLAGAHGMIATVIKITKVNLVIEMFPTAGEAAANFPSAVEGGA